MKDEEGIMNELVFKKLDGVKSPMIFLLTLIVFVSSCNKNPSEEEYLRERGIVKCEYILKKTNVPIEYISRAEDVLEKWKNNLLDPEPVLIIAALVRPQDMSIHLVIEASDEDNDIVGIVIKEKLIKSDEQTVFIEEEYPVFINLKMIPAETYVLPVMIRKNDERKNEKQWKVFSDIGFFHKDLMPFIWISLPDPGKIDIEVSVYDRKGHKSALTPLVNMLNDDPNNVG